MSVLEKLRERGFIAQTVYEEELTQALAEGPMTFYCGFDPTADSLHIGHYIPLMMMAHLQQAGHKPIILVGGGTAMVGDPSGKNSMRSMMTQEIVDANVEALKGQLAQFLSFEGDNAAVMVNNADWLRKLEYIPFLREIGAHFSVNRMLTAECYRARMESGLTFLEFNYMLMQAFDFYRLYKDYNCRMQVGGDDQWSNILAGADLVRRKCRGQAFAVTTPLLLTSTGDKMGKTTAGALWLSADKTSAYDFYQYFRNVADADVGPCLARLTFLPMEEVTRLSALKDAQINEAKEVLAYETTKLVHGPEAAGQAQQAARALFGAGQNDENMPTVTLAEAPASFADALVAAGLCKSKSEARRLAAGGGVSCDGDKIADADGAAPQSGEYVLRRGKKDYCKVVVG